MYHLIEETELFLLFSWKVYFFRQYRHFGVFPQGMQIGSDQYLLSLKGLLKRNLTTKCLAAYPCLISGSPRVQAQMNSAAAPIIWLISQRQQCCSSRSPHCLLIIPVQSSSPPEHHCALSTSHPQLSLAANWESGITSALPPWISMTTLYITHGMCLHMHHQTAVPHITSTHLGGWFTKGINCSLLKVNAKLSWGCIHTFTFWEHAENVHCTCVVIIY